MSPDRNRTPEKELLRLIENPNSSPSIKSATIKRKGISLFSLSSIKAGFSFLKEKFKGEARFSHGYWIELRTINMFLKIAILGLFAYLVIDTSMLYKQIQNRVEFITTGVKSEKSSRPFVVTPLLKSAPYYYLDNIRGRDIFKMGSRVIVEDKTEKKKKTSKVVSSKIIEATQHLRLVGISWSDDPDAMIEDTKALRTFFVKRGQTIGQLKVQAIFKDKVVLSLDGEEIELR